MLYDQFIKEKRFLNNLSANTLQYYEWVFNRWNKRYIIVNRLIHTPMEINRSPKILFLFFLFEAILLFLLGVAGNLVPNLKGQSTLLWVGFLTLCGAAIGLLAGISYYKFVYSTEGQDGLGLEVKRRPSKWEPIDVTTPAVPESYTEEEFRRIDDLAMKRTFLIGGIGMFIAIPLIALEPYNLAFQVGYVALLLSIAFGSCLPIFRAPRPRRETVAFTDYFVLPFFIAMVCGIPVLLFWGIVALIVIKLS